MKSKFNYCYCNDFLEICLLENNNIGLKKCCYLAPFKILSKEEFNQIQDIIDYSNKNSSITKQIIFKNICDNNCILGQIKTVAVGLSYACNLNCYHCFYKDHSYNESQEKYYYNVLYNLKNKNLNKLILSTSGEVFFSWKLLIKYLSSLSQNDFKEIVFQTNALLLNKQKIQLLYKISNLTKIKYNFRVSVDAISEKTYQATRGGNINKLFKNIFYIKTIFGNENISLNFTIKQTNVNELKFVEAFYKEKFDLNVGIFYDVFDDNMEKIFNQL